MDYPEVGISIGVLRSETFDSLVTTLKLAVATLRGADVPFLLGGSFAACARSQRDRAVNRTIATGWRIP